jgi:hypothetical protein
MTRPRIRIQTVKYTWSESEFSELSNLQNSRIVILKILKFSEF